MSPPLAHRVAIVTGAAAGIGRACCVALAEAGARVVVSDLAASEEGGLETVRLVEDVGGEARWVPCDVAREPEVRHLVEDTIRAFGRLDVAVNNAGIDGRQAPLADHPEDNYTRVLDVNLHGTWLCMKYQIPHMTAPRADGSRGGSIINMSSIAGLIGYPTIAPYVASKHGVIGLTKTAALEVAASGVRVNAVCPAAIQTAMIDRVVPPGSEQRQAMEAAHPLGRFGRPEEVASAVVWLASDGSSFVTGHSLVVDGGYTIR